MPFRQDAVAAPRNVAAARPNSTDKVAVYWYRVAACGSWASAGMQLGAIDDHAGLAVLAHLLERERAANHVAGEALPAFGIVGPSTDAVMHREA